MLNEIKYIWYGMTYKQLRQTLKDGKKLRAFPLVDNPESMILLGSIQRGELLTCIGKKRKKRKMFTLKPRYNELRYSEFHNIVNKTQLPF